LPASSGFNRNGAVPIFKKYDIFSKKVVADAPIGESPIAKKRYIRNLDPI
jgi:hypothetical protein